MVRRVTDPAFGCDAALLKHLHPSLLVWGSEPAVPTAARGEGRA